MSSENDRLLAHLKTGNTRVARCYAVRRRDGVTLGFTDHDRDLTFAGLTYRANTGITAKVLAQTTGLAVDESETFGALVSDAVSETDIAAGRYDGAEVESWLVQWDDLDARMLQFRGHIGEITRGAGAFTAELRGLADKLNQPFGRVYHPRCSAVLGDGACKVDLSVGAFGYDGTIVAAGVRLDILLSGTQVPADGWFTGGRITVLSGAASGLVAHIERDRAQAGGQRQLSLWDAIGVAPSAGDLVRVEAGCDKSFATCNAKFLNSLNFRGFPDIPGEDWLVAVPRKGNGNTGGSRSG